MRFYAHTVVACGGLRCQVLDMDNLARIRKARKLTQTQLAEAVGANQATISKIEKGLGNPTLDMIERIAAALKVHPSQLFTRNALEQRAVDALEKMTDDHTKEAAIIVLETMAHRAN